MLNIDTLIRMADTNDEIEEPMSYLLPGGSYLNERLFKRLIDAKDISNLLDALRAAVPLYAEPLTIGNEGYQMTGHLSEFQRALEAWTTRRTITEGYRDILGFGVAQSYLTAKENETTNLGIIAHGVYRGVAPSIIERDLILV
jgi:vacuolar-type H+-ATPase subunit C/Vma6